MKYISLICALGIIPAAVASNEHGPCELLLYNGTILTFDDKGTTASAIEITGNIITSMWLEDPAKRNCVQAIDLAGRTVIPGVTKLLMFSLYRMINPPLILGPVWSVIQITLQDYRSIRRKVGVHRSKHLCDLLLANIGFARMHVYAVDNEIVIIGFQYCSTPMSREQPLDIIWTSTGGERFVG